MPQSTTPRIIVALDFPDRRPALELIEQLDPTTCRVKIGKEMFTRYGPPLVEEITRRGFDLFLDLKFHDIPNTTAAACAAAADLGVWMINLHASGGRKMMETARAQLDQLSAPPLLIAVTILTSLSAEDIAETGLSGEPGENVLRLAQLAAAAGMDGVVCSPREAAEVRAASHDRFLLVTPGVRPTGATSNDQQRITTPSDALARGSDYLVIGRPITATPDPAQALAAIRREIGEEG
jgi:orotidine-5'-phosphate decarboxylase